jgi:Tripartite ATP-independent periplasmic transporter, DctM component
MVLVAGGFRPPVAVILMVMPIHTPVLEAADFDLIWFAVILTINVEVGLITPPVGPNLYVLKGVAPDVPLPAVLKGSMPFVLLMSVAMVLISVFPQIALWLPSKMVGRECSGMRATGGAAHRPASRVARQRDPRTGGAAADVVGGYARTTRYWCSASNAALGSEATISSRARAAPVGRVLCCSQFCSVRRFTPVSFAN